jgi:uncharacterized membrane protein
MFGQIALLQAALCLAVVFAAPTIVEATGLLFRQVGILRLGAAGALFQFLFFAATSLLVFFERHREFLALQMVFLVLQGSFAMISLELGPAYYGYGYLAACVLSAALALAFLERCMEELVFVTFVLSNAKRRTVSVWTRALHFLHRSGVRTIKME